ncbi:MAG: Xaa-Pro peptidase family protein [Bacteroidales bacterium]|nr:Xaa-Pro peptidase family protein [Bacteroidales bacterium]
MNNTSFIPQGWENEIKVRVANISAQLRQNGIDAVLLSDNVSLYYTSGRVFAGFTYITAKGNVYYCVRRPIGFEGEANVHYIRKPEMIPALIETLPKTLALKTDVLTVAEYNRLSQVFPDADIVDASIMMRSLRSVKSDFEQSLLKDCGIHHEAAYSRIPAVYHTGMTDVQLQIEIERLLRLEGCLGIFRVQGNSMELFMGNILVGENADSPTPYDFAMGGSGVDASLPVGASGEEITSGKTVMVDACGNFNGYMTDMTRCFRIGEVPELALKAHNLSVSINRRLAEFGAGTPAKHLYDEAVRMVEEAALSDYFMGHAQKAGFVGHGLGIEINEAPVLAPRSRDILEEGQVVAIEPKFVIPGVGAVGIENTYIVRADYLECITNAPEEMIALS